MNEQISPIPVSSDQIIVIVEKAPIWKRLLAYVIDSIIIGIVIFLLALARIVRSLWVGIAIWELYFIWSYSAQGQTVGKELMKIKVVSIDGSPLNLWKGVLRSVGYIISSLFFYLGILWALWDGDKQAWHDKIAGTCVVPADVARESLKGTIAPSEARRRQVRWLLGLGIPFLLYLVWLLFF